MHTNSVSARRPRAVALVPASIHLALLAVAFLASCNSGARVTATGESNEEEVSGEAQSLDVEFALRRDFFLAGRDNLDGFLGDLAVADLDADGDTDLVQSNFADHTISVAYGTGFGEIGLVETYPTAGAPLKIVTGDFDADGDVDLAVAILDREFDVDVGTPINGVQIFLQSADGFQNHTVRELGAEPFDLAAAPVGNGAADELLVTVPDERRTRWFRLVGGELELVQDLTSFVAGAFGSPLDVAVVDLEGDGSLDVLVSEEKVEGDLPDRIVLHRDLMPVAGAPFGPGGGASGPGQSSSALFPSAEPGVGESQSLLSEFDLRTPLVFDVGDVDGDARDEVVVVEFEGTRGFLLGLDENGEFGLTELDFGAGVLAVIVEDLNGDDLPDLAAALWNQGAVSVQFADAPGSFDAGSITLSVGYFPRALHAIDLDDRDPNSTGMDLLTCNTHDLGFLEARVDGYKAAYGYEIEAGTDVSPTALCAGDLDGDGNQDVVAIDVHQRALAFFAGDGTGELAFAGSVTLSNETAETPGYLLPVDVDGDGDLDLVTPVWQSDELVILGNNGTLPFEIVSRVAVGDSPRGVAAADFNGDGNIDLAVTNHSDRTVLTCLGDGQGSFEVHSAAAVSAPPLAIEAYDVDLDGNADCVVSTGIGGPQEAFFVVLAGAGDGTLSEALALPMGAQAQVLFCSDLDGASDGNELCDIVASQGGEIADEIVVFRNTSGPDGIAFTAQTLDIGLNPGTLDVSDIDRDGDPDLLVLLGRGELVVARNDGTGSFPAADFLPARDPFLDQEGPLRGWSAPFGTVASALADLDGDEREELILASPRAPYVWVARNESSLPEVP